MVTQLYNVHDRLHCDMRQLTSLSKAFKNVQSYRDCDVQELTTSPIQWRDGGIIFGPHRAGPENVNTCKHLLKADTVR